MICRKRHKCRLMVRRKQNPQTASKKLTTPVMRKPKYVVNSMISQHCLIKTKIPGWLLGNWRRLLRRFHNQKKIERRLEQKLLDEVGRIYQPTNQRILIVRLIAQRLPHKQRAKRSKNSNSAPKRFRRKIPSEPKIFVRQQIVATMNHSLREWIKPSRRREKIDLMKRSNHQRRLRRLCKK